MARVVFHDNVRKALEKDNWTITADPLRLKTGKVRVEIDLSAEPLISAEKDFQKLAVEVKSFLNRSAVRDFECAYGQDRLYRKVLVKTEPDRMLFMAIPKLVHDTFFHRPLIQEIVEEESMNLLVFDAETNTIVQWKK